MRPSSSYTELGRCSMASDEQQRRMKREYDEGTPVERKKVADEKCESTIHEAGHVVMKWLVYGTPGSARIWQDDKGGWRGECDPDRPREAKEAMARGDCQVLEREVLVAVAGGVATDLAGGCAQWFDPRARCADDFKSAIELLCRRKGNGFNHRGDFERQVERAKPLLEENWGSIEALANVLCEELCVSNCRAEEVIGAAVKRGD